MIRVNEEGFVVYIPPVRMRVNKPRKMVVRNWWLPRTTDSNRCIILLGNHFSISLPPKYMNKRVRIKIEILDEIKNENDNTAEMP
jgi:hypothetical protein